MRNRNIEYDMGEWNAVFAATIWWLWKWRNKEVFKGESKSIYHKVEWTRKQCKEIKDAFNRRPSIISKSNPRVTKLLRWEQLERGWIKLNSDGSCNTLTGKAACGGALRDEQGNWIVGFSANLGTITTDEAEAWGLYYGIKLAWEKGFRKVIIECYSKKIIDWVTKDVYA